MFLLVSVRHVGAHPDVSDDVNTSIFMPTIMLAQSRSTKALLGRKELERDARPISSKTPFLLNES